MSMFREAPGADGKPGPVSARRVVGVFCFFVAAFLAVFALVIKKETSWQEFIPVGIFAASGLLLFFFTSWTDVSGVISAVRGK
jgi:hypothetical protein